MESEERREARLIRRRENTKQRKCNFLSEEKGIDSACHLIYCSATEGIAATKRASEMVCEGDAYIVLFSVN